MELLAWNQSEAINICTRGRLRIHRFRLCSVAEVLLKHSICGASVGAKHDITTLNFGGG